MVTRRKTEMEKSRGAFRRAFAQLGRSLPATLKGNWRNVVMPWRLLPVPVALALIALVALAMVLDGLGVVGDVATIGGQPVPAALACAEDESIAFVGIPDTLVCVHVENYAEPDAGCTRPAFYSKALGVCVLTVATPAATATDTPTGSPLPTATPQ